MVFAGKHPVRHQVQNLRQLGGVILADGEDDGLANLAAYRVAQGIFQKRLAEEFVGGLGEEPFFKLALLVGFLLVFSRSSLNSTIKPWSESNCVVMPVRASTTVGLIK